MVFLIILIVLILLYVFLLIPRLPRRDMSALTKVDYAHRGLWNAAGEQPVRISIGGRCGVRH